MDDAEILRVLERIIDIMEKDYFSFEIIEPYDIDVVRQAYQSILKNLPRTLSENNKKEDKDGGRAVCVSIRLDIGGITLDISVH